MRKIGNWGMAVLWCVSLQYMCFSSDVVADACSLGDRFDAGGRRALHGIWLHRERGGIRNVAQGKRGLNRFTCRWECGERVPLYTLLVSNYNTCVLCDATAGRVLVV